MLWFERQVVGTLDDPDARARRPVRPSSRTCRPRCVRCPSTCGRRRRGIDRARRLLVARAPARTPRRRRLGTRRIDRWKTSKIDPIRQYVRLLESLVLFAENELAPDGAGVNAVKRPAETIDTDVLIIGSGAGGAVTAATLARAGPLGHDPRRGPVGRPRRARAVLAAGDGRQVPPRRLVRGARPPRDRVRRGPLRRRQHRDQQRALPPPARRPRRGMAARLPDRRVRPDALDRYADRIEQELGVSRLPGAPPASSAVLERGATKLGWRSVEFARVFRYEANGRAVKQTMARTMLPSAIEAGAPHHRRLPGRAAGAPRPPHRRRDLRTDPARRHGPALLVAGRPRVRLRGRDPDARAAPAQRHPAQHRPRPEDAPDREDRGALRLARSTTATCRCTASPSSRPASRSAGRRAARATSRSRSPTPTPTTPTRSRTGSTSPCTTPRSAAKAPAACSRCPASGRRSSPTTSPKAT